MLNRSYRQRLETDLARWQADGVITPAAVAAIRGALPPAGPGLNIAVAVGIVGGLLIAAACLAFVAANWTGIARLLRFAMLVAGILGAHGFGAWFARSGRPVLADLCAGVGAIIFGAAIALVGQMYHLGDDFAGGMLLWAGGALAAAALTGARSALAVALVAACTWSAMRVTGAHALPHLPFVAFWLAAAGLAVGWKSRVAAHLVALAALSWWIAAGIEFKLDDFGILADGAALLFGGGLALAIAREEGLSGCGAVLSIYGAFSLAVVAALEVATANDVLFFHAGAASVPLWANACGVAGVIAAFTVAGMTRSGGAAFAGAAIGLVLIVPVVWVPQQSGEPWLAYAVALCAMLCLVVSGMLDDARPRIVAGWLGLAGVIAGITWAVKGSLLRRSVFLAVAGAVAIALATLLNRLLPRSEE
jgi:uncharacterized membrane protein